ncbi:MAG TPA: YihY/virulence factor BrkB family protein [Jiangellaceae bacterium]|nr:YihY/virulence factor BrkB family protein [Jiangellaceae bacterium]
MNARARYLIARGETVAARLTSMRVVRAAIRYTEMRGNRLAGAVSFYGFISLFALLTLTGSIALTLIGDDGVRALQEIVDDYLPGLGINVAAIADNAGTVGLIGGIVLLWTGLGWVDSTRAAVRSMWRLYDAPGNYVTRKLIDFAALLGLGVLLLVSWAATVMVDAAAEEVLGWLDIAGGTTGWLSRGSALGLGIVSSSVLFGYMLAGLPRIAVPIRVLLPAAVLGGLVFELLKQLVTQFAVFAVPDNSVAAFAVPLALLAWIYLVTRLLMLLAASTAEWATEHSTSPTGKGEWSGG